MTHSERALIEAALAWKNKCGPGCDSELLSACEALLAERAKMRSAPSSIAERELDAGERYLATFDACHGYFGPPKPEMKATDKWRIGPFYFEEPPKSGVSELLCPWTAKAVERLYRAADGREEWRVEP